MRTYVRSVVWVLAVFELVLGFWLTFAPKTFYDHVPTVNWTPPYSDHLFHDFGGASLGLGIVLAAAAIRLDRFWTVIVLVAYLAYAGPHLVFHLGHLEGDERGLSIALAVILALMVVLPLTALAGTRKLT
jgi:FtsH-binding integral membrane protein